MPKHIREEGEIADTEDSSSSPTDTQQIATLVSRTRRSREGILSRQTAKKSCVQHVVRQKSKKCLWLTVVSVCCLLCLWLCLRVLSCALHTASGYRKKVDEPGMTFTKVFPSQSIPLPSGRDELESSVTGVNTFDRLRRFQTIHPLFHPLPFAQINSPQYFSPSQVQQWRGRHRVPFTGGKRGMTPPSSPLLPYPVVYDIAGKEERSAGEEGRMLRKSSLVCSSDPTPTLFPLHFFVHNYCGWKQAHKGLKYKQQTKLASFFFSPFCFLFCGAAVV